MRKRISRVHNEAEIINSATFLISRLTNSAARAEPWQYYGATNCGEGVVLHLPNVHTTTETKGDVVVIGSLSRENKTKKSTSRWTLVLLATIITLAVYYRYLQTNRKLNG